MKRPPLYVLPGSNPGLLIRGNIDINNRPAVKNPKGGVSSVYTTSFSTMVDGRNVEILIPQVIPGKILSARAAWNYYWVKRHQHLGIFDNVTHANMYARRLHLQQARLSGQGG